MSRKEMQKRRIMKYFIDAALEIIKKEGLENVTIRKVAVLAGYNSATLYNYFENLDHLLFYSSMKYLRNYLLKLQKMKMPQDKLERFFIIWRTFAEEGFNNAPFFHQIFYTNYDMEFNDAVKQYYEIYPEELKNLSEDLLPMLTETNIYKRDLEVLTACVNAGLLNEADLEPINDMIILLFQGFLIRVKGDIETPINDYVDTFMDYLKRIMGAHLIQK